MKELKIIGIVAVLLILVCLVLAGTVQAVKTPKEEWNKIGKMKVFYFIMI